MATNWGSSAGSGAGAANRRLGNQTSTGAYNTGKTTDQPYKGTKTVNSSPKGSVASAGTNGNASNLTPTQATAVNNLSLGNKAAETRKAETAPTSNLITATVSNPVVNKMDAQLTPAPVKDPTPTPKSYAELNGLTKTQVIRNGSPVTAYLQNGKTVDENGNAFSFRNGDVVSTDGGYYLWNNGAAQKISQQEVNALMGIGTPQVAEDQLNGLNPYSGFTYNESGPTNYIEDYYQNQFDSLAKQQSMMNDWYKEQMQNITDMVNASTQKGVLELQAQLENGLGDYDQQRAAAAINQARAANNAALRNSAAGDMGGIGQKQYSAEQNSYDQQMMNIQLEQINFQNQVNQQIAQLEAEGRYQEAQLLSEWGQQKVNALQDQYNWYWEMRYKNAYDIDYLHRTVEAEAYDRQVAEQERDYNRAMQRLQLGIFNAEDAAALGIPAEQAQSLADYYQQMAAIDLEAAQADLANRLAKANGSGSGSGGGGGRYYSGGGGGGGGDTPTAQEQSMFEKFYAAGYEPGSYELYNALLKAGYGTAQWRLEDQMDYYDQYYEARQKSDPITYPVATGAAAGAYAAYDALNRINNPKITNPHDDDEINVPGMGIMTYPQLRNYVNAGRVREINDGKGNITYVMVAGGGGGGKNVITSR